MEVGAENKSKQSNENTSIEKMLGKIRTGGTKNTKPAKKSPFYFVTERLDSRTRHELL